MTDIEKMSVSFLKENLARAEHFLSRNPGPRYGESYRGIIKAIKAELATRKDKT